MEMFMIHYLRQVTTQISIFVIKEVSRTNA